MEILRLVDLKDVQHVSLILDGDEIDANVAHNIFHGRHSFTWIDKDTAERKELWVQPDHAIAIVQVLGDIVVAYNRNK